jgi:fructose-1,6-bisphosphatase/inositol monophosphatase family enzyme
MNERYLKFALEIAEKAKEIMLGYYGYNIDSEYKADQTIVTKADNEINHYLIERVKEEFPTHSVDGEEEKMGKSNYVWVCDPVDGTAMYARHIPVAVFSLALVINGVPNIGVVYDPFTDNLYTAIKRKGAYKNNEKISVNNYTLDNIQTVCHCDMWSKAQYNVCKVFEELRKKTRLNDIGSITRASCCVATGDYSLAIFTGTKHKHCDIAAVKVIVEEAGGKVTDLLGNEQRYDQSIKGALISNGIIHDEVIETIKKYIIEE